MPDPRARRRPFSAFFCCFLVSLVCRVPAWAAANPVYDAAVAEAKANAADPGPWIVTDLKVITGPGSGDGNTYVDGKLVAATFTKSSYYTSAFPGTVMSVYGSPTSSASWVTIGGELKSYWSRMGVTAAGVKLATSQAVGMADGNTNDAIVEMLVTPTLEAIQRPTKDPSIAAQPTSLGSLAAFVQPAGMSDAAFANFTAYYNNWEASAYGADNFPWTQLGYTYRWGHGNSLADIRGLSEFILPGSSKYTVYAVYSLTSYLYTAGNGSGDFAVTGDLDTLWAGRNFQPRGDTVRIDAGATVSGGQGLLISSPGYTVTNSGAITGSTTAKFGLAGTEDVAVLFLGQLPGAGTLAAPAGSGNTLVNTGRIDSPGTAVRADAGDTHIINSGTLSGGSLAVQTAAGNDRLEVAGGTVSGRVDLGAGVDSLTTSGASTLAFSLSPLGVSAAPVENVETVRLGGDTTLALTFDAAGYVVNGQRYTIVQADSLSVPESGLTVSSNLPMVRFLAASDGAGLTVAGYRDLGWYTRSAANASLGAALDGITTTVNPALEGLIGLLDQSGDPAGATSRLLPGPQTRAMVVAVDAASAWSSAFAGRMRGLRAPATGSGVGSGGLAPAGFRTQDLRLSELADLGQSVVSGRAAFGPTPWQAALPADAAGADAAGPAAALPELSREGPIEAFASVYGAKGQGASSGDAPGYDSTLTGVLAGAGARVAPWARLGLVGGYAWSRADFSSGKGTSDDHVWRLGPYLGLDLAPYTVDAMLTYGAHRVTTERPVWNSTAQSRSTMGEWLGYLRAARTVALGAAVVAEPFAEGQYLHLHRDGYGESGAGAANLDFPAADSTSVTSVLGLRLEKSFEVGGYTLTPDVWGGWRHEYADTAPLVRAAFAGAPDRQFAASGGACDRDQARFGAGISLRGEAGRAVSARFDGTAGGTRSDMALSVGVRLTF
ncbi:autotransporter family protein [Desulfovibrio sp. TomC]|uniref:autotransporter family protein n=1 Tax=Desulfovibrio sp. TomC TaxID=1562888 RepID=UPI00057411CC|nr:autotransporter outer membrane beta-barrel domain-containing protein [Desulfovibrio sp. TomC]KHK02575.1 Outer membrane autotransporter barrel [Desulfovibrio sp. TomC]